MLAVLVGATLVLFSLRRFAFVIGALLPPRRPGPAAQCAPTITVVVPARNEAAGIASLLDALDRTAFPAEDRTIVLVDDASVDGTAALLAAHAATRPGTIVLVLLQPVGRFEAVNRGIAAAPRSDLIAVCDADLRPRPNWLIRLAAVFGDPSVGAAAAFLSPRNARANPVARYAAVESWVHQLIACAAKDRFALDPPAHGAAMFRRAALERIGGFPAGIPGGDVWASLAIARSGFRTRFVPAAVVDATVVDRLDHYWGQHIRWARNLYAAPRRQPDGDGRLGIARRIEVWTAAAGYADRLSLVAASALAIAGELPAALPVAYLAIAGLEVAVAVARAGAPAEIPAFAAATVAIFPVDALGALVATAAHLFRRPRPWHSPRDGSPGPA